MPETRLTSSERRLWLLAALWLGAVYASIAFVRAPTELLRERNLLRLVVAALFVAVAAVLVRWAVRRRPGRRERAALVLSLAVIGISVAVTERPEERVHFLQYGVFAALIYAALGERAARRRGDPGAGGWRVALAAIALTALAGWGDEGIQRLLPDRVYDLRDVALNAWAGTLAVAAMTAIGWTRERDRAESGVGG